jgi:hypothetical protein
VLLIDDDVAARNLGLPSELATVARELAPR